MSTETNKQTVRQFYQHLANRDFDQVFALMAPDAVWWLPGAELGGTTLPKETMRGMIDAFYGVFERPPEMKLSRITAEEDRVCVEASSRGGLTRSGASYGNDYHMLFQFRDGLITEIREYMNPRFGAPVLAEVGALSAD